MPPAVRVSDKAAAPNDAHGCPACPHPVFGPAVNGSTDVFINKLPAVRLDDPGIHMACCGPNQWQVSKGSSTVYVNKKPLARMGDKTKHCGSSGQLINGSPNVFIDDGALKAKAVKDGKTKDGEAGSAKDAKHDGKEKSKSGSWESKEGKGGKGKKQKAGEGPADDEKDAKAGKDEDLSTDASEEGKNTGGLLKIKSTSKLSRPGQKVEYEVDYEKADDLKGKNVEVKVFDKVSGEYVFGEDKKLSLTIPSNLKSPLKGTFEIPEFGEEQAKFELVVEAVIEGKDPVKAADPVIVSKQGGLLFELSVEKPKLAPGLTRAPAQVKASDIADPTNTAEDEPQPLQNDGPVTITVELTLADGKKVTKTLEFDGGSVFLDEELELKGPPPENGAAWPESVVKVVKVDGLDAKKFPAVKARAFAPSGK